MSNHRPITRWYALAVAYAQCPREHLDAFLTARGTPIRRNLRCTLEALAHLQPYVGNALDEAEAPFLVAQYVAHGDGAAEQLRRATESLSELFERREKREKRQQPFGQTILEFLRKGGRSRLSSPR